MFYLCLTPPHLPRVCVPEAQRRGERCPSWQEEVEEEEAALVRQGQDALKKALDILEDQRGWKKEISEVTDNNSNNKNNNNNSRILFLYLMF